MKLKSLVGIFLAIIFTFSLLIAQTKDKSAKKTSDNKSDCPMNSMKSGNKDCLPKDGKMSENCSHGDKVKAKMSKDGKKAGCDMTKISLKDCCKKDGKTSENCTHSEKEKCDNAKTNVKDHPIGKAKTIEVKETEKKIE